MVKLRTDEFFARNRKTWLHNHVLQISTAKNWFTKSAFWFNPIQTGLFSTFRDQGGLQKPHPPHLTLKSLMAIKFAQDSVRTNSDHYRYCDVTVTWNDVIMTSFVSQCFTLKLYGNKFNEYCACRSLNTFLVIKGVYNTFFECIFLVHMKFCRWISY